MIAAYNPFVIPAITLCDDVDIPALPACQDNIMYRQNLSQICGLLMLPVGATGPEDWESAVDWLDVVDNTNTDNTKAKYLVGRGAFLPLTRVEVSLSGGRLLESRERVYALTFNVLNMNDGHTDFGRKLQNNTRNFYVWLQTLDDRIIGGPEGMRPYFVNADFPFAEGNTDREVMQITIYTAFHNLPAMSSVAVDLSSPDAPDIPTDDIQTQLSLLPEYIDDDDAAGDGLADGKSYWVLPGNDAIPAGVLKKKGLP